MSDSEIMYVCVCQIHARKQSKSTNSSIRRQVDSAHEGPAGVSARVKFDLEIIRANHIARVLIGFRTKTVKNCN